MTTIDDAIGFGVALGIGLLIGLERERAKGRGPQREPAGVRSFALLGLSGAVAESLGPVALAVAGASVIALAATSYLATRLRDPGLTTEIAMMVVWLLGALAARSPQAAAALGVVTTLLLANRRRLHRFSRRLLSRREMHDLLVLAAAAFVVLPLLPDRSIDPWQALNPRRLWVLAVAVMSVSSLGHLALRLLGARVGLPIAGLAGGFVSSTATIAAMGDRARASPSLRGVAASAGLMSNVATVVQLAIVIGVLSQPLLARTAPALAAAGAVAVLAAAWAARAARRDPEPVRMAASQHPFELSAALRFVALLAAVMLAAAVARAHLGPASLPWVLALSGLADVHAAAASAAQLAGAGLDLDTARAGVSAAFAANSAMKCFVAWHRGGAGFAVRVVPGIAAMAAAFAAANAWR